MAWSRQITPPRVIARPLARLVAAGVVVLLGAAACADSVTGSDAETPPGTLSPAPTPAADPAAPVWGFARSDEVAPAIGVSRTAAAQTQAGSWQLSASTAGDKAKIIRRDTGRYSVVFPGLGVPGGRGAAVVTTIGDAAVHCRAEDWGPSGRDEEVRVACRSVVGGTYIDSRFTALFTFAPAAHRPNPGEPYAYFRNDSPSAPLVRPENHYSLAGPGTIEINRIGTGHYSIDLIGALYARRGNNMLVNALGSTTVGCNALGRDVHPDRQTIFVGCADGRTWTDSPFVLVYGNQHSMIPVERPTFGHSFNGLEEAGTGRIVQPPLGRTVNVWERYSANSARKVNTVRHVSAGTYELTFPGVGRASDHVQVTPYGEPTHRCTLEGWTSPGQGSAGDVTMKIGCFDPAGVRSDTHFSLTYVSSAGLTS